ncbi:uncharacterized protein LOC119992754 [Tripterygium wilfordii]|uniref:uncharacterized protein LOC119992754 n=1 Tax=Tripterygium wilfordii TaxID=458696 RepID=UPI0018F83E9C|nr:uncharacterized protein LOC119992754 [Tripterygium wilfordii]
MAKQNARQWHETLAQALWAHRTSPRSAISNELGKDDYTKAMMQNLLELDEIRLDALNRIEVQKTKIAKSYNKRVVVKSFEPGELVWKARLPLDFKDPKYEKWSPNWEGPYQVESAKRPTKQPLPQIVAYADQLAKKLTEYHQ